MISEKEIVSPTYESLGVEKFDSVSISQKVVCRFESHFVDISISGRYEQVYIWLHLFHSFSIDVIFVRFHW